MSSINYDFVRVDNIGARVGKLRNLLLTDRKK